MALSIQDEKQKSMAAVERGSFAAQAAAGAVLARSAIDPTPASATTVDAEVPTSEFGALGLEEKRRLGWRSQDSCFPSPSGRGRRLARAASEAEDA